MIFSVIAYIVLGIIIIGIIILIREQTTGLLDEIDLSELAKYEGNIKNLKEIIIICDRLEEPTGALFEAVKSNFKKGAKYNFIISKNNFHKQTNICNFFDSVAKNFTTHDYQQVFLHPLNFDWHGVPNVFYKYYDEETSTSKIFAYEGDMAKEGISNTYKLINPSMAFNLLELIFKGVNIPHMEPLNLANFENIHPILTPMKVA